jgi:hypothetical protein
MASNAVEMMNLKSLTLDFSFSLLRNVQIGSVLPLAFHSIVTGTISQGKVAGA